MKILLIGEYSRLHNSLKEGLVALGHEVTIVSSGDGFKQYSSDYSIESKSIENSYLLKTIKRIVYKLSKFNIESTERGLMFYRLLSKLQGFDHVQLINSDALETHPRYAKWLLSKLLAQNGNMSLLVCGDETPIVDYYLADKFSYSVLTPYLQNKSLKKYYSYSLKYVSNEHRELFTWIESKAHALITSDIDYEIPMHQMGFTTQLIPNPINTDNINFTPLVIEKKIVIFLGINRGSYIKKGIIYFEEALNIIRNYYKDRVEIIITENMPYNEYIKLYDSAHIVLDQVHAYDQGYNALEAMAKGKVVFTGAETEFTEHYKLAAKVAINALPSTESIVNEISHLIENPNDIIAIGKRARAFIEREHNYIKVAEKYLGVWRKN
jgi:glycosyltransferase involved in cell wall biosynthesis